MDGDKVRSPAHWFCTVRRGGAGRTGTRRLAAVANKGAETFHRSEAPSRLARSCCPARTFRHLRCNTFLAPCPLYPLPRGTAPAAARIEGSLAIGLPTQGEEKTLLSGARHGCAGAEGGRESGHRNALLKRQQGPDSTRIGAGAIRARTDESAPVRVGPDPLGVW